MPASDQDTLLAQYASTFDGKTLMIRKATLDDCTNLTALALQVWLDTYTLQGLRQPISEYALSVFKEEHFRALIANPDNEIWVCINDDHLTGFITIDLAAEFKNSDNGYEIATLYVSRHFQGQGIASSLLQKIEAVYGAPFWLSTWVHNQRAIEFYTHRGFEIIGELWFELGSERHKNHVFRYSGIDGKTSS